MNLQEEILKIKNELLDEFDKRVEALKIDEQEFPKIGRRFYVITTEGKVIHERWEDDGWDRSALSIGNVFETKDQADFAAEKLKVEAELRKLSDSWDLELTQYSFSFDWECGELKIEYPDYNQYPNSYYFYSIDDLQQAIETVGKERIKKYIFGVED